jgi:hypothetical protein
MKVSAQGGSAEPVTVIDKSKHSTHRWPWFMPDGKHFIFLATNHTGGDPKQNGIYFGSVDNSDIHFVTATDSAAQYADGYLLYRANSALVAQPFDPKNGALLGPPTALVNNLRDDVGVWRSIFAVSEKGVLTYQIGSAASAKSRLSWIDRSGKTLADFDPDENTILNARLGPIASVWHLRAPPAFGPSILSARRKTRVTFDPVLNQEPTWSPDGKTLMFSAPVVKGGGNVEIRSKAADGSGTEKQVIAQQNNYHHPAWSPDGKYVTYLFGDSEKMVSLWIVPTAGDAKPLAIVQPPSAQSNLYSYRVSPDSRWVAYASDESGQTEVYITSFPEGNGKWKVSAGSGAYPAWSANGKELFYQSILQDFYVCTVAVKGSEIEVGTPQRLFNSPTPAIGAGFDASSDGKRLLVNRIQEETQAPLQLITNWPAELKK